MAVVGDFDPEQIREISEEIFADWSAEKPYVRFGRPYHDVGPEHMVFETPDKANAIMLAGLNIEMSDSHPDYPAMVLGNYMLGGGFLNSRLATRIRQREGLSYGVGSNFSAHPIDKRGSLNVYAIFAPENAEKVEAAFREEIRKVVESGFTAEEVEAARQGWLQSREVSRAQDRSLANTLGATLFFDRTMEHEAELDAKVAALTTEQVNQAMRRHLDPGKFVVVLAGDFAGAQERVGTGGGR